jgi:translation initiation factor 1A
MFFFFFGIYLFFLSLPPLCLADVPYSPETYHCYFPIREISEMQRGTETRINVADISPPNPTEYAQVVKMLGNGRLETQCFDGTKRLGHIRGKLRKKVWINQGDIILLSLRDYQDEKGDVILKYTADEARSLKAYGELPETAKINETDTYGPNEDGECNFEFDEDRDSESDEGAAGKEIEIDDI